MPEARSKTEKVVELCKRRGIIFPAAEIYGGIAGFFEYGPVGVRIKRKLIEDWRKFFVESEENIYEIEGCLILPDKVFEASGHLEHFVDPLTQCKSCKAMFRADNLIEESTGKFVEGLPPEELTKILREERISCPKCGGELSDVKMFNLLLKTEVGPAGGEKASLRPETAQNIFLNFKRIYQSMRAKLPFGVAQVGKSFRNEISPRQFLVRLREFTQCEIEMFVDPRKVNECEGFERVKDVSIRLYTAEAQRKGEREMEIKVGEAVEKGLIPNKWMGYFMAKEFLWFLSLGIPREALRFRQMLPEETPHYSKGNFDLEIEFEFGFKECVGNAYRSDYDLRRHSQFSGEELAVVTPEGEKIIPHVIEPSFGVERPFLAILYHCFVEDKERGWNWLALPPKISPFIAGVFPLVSKDGLPEKAKEVYKMLKESGFDVVYDEKGSIGKRYARIDEIGVPLAITIDYQTLQDDTVTVRDRDTTKQVRVKILELKDIFQRVVDKNSTKDIF